jgi:hypothetical protein
MPIRRAGFGSGVLLCRWCAAGRAACSDGDAQTSARGDPGVGVVGLGVVRQDALDVDAVVGVPGDGSLEEAAAGVCVLAGEQLGVGEPGVIIDGDMQVLPADTAILRWTTRLATKHAFARLPETAQLLGINVQELARRLTLISACAAGGTNHPRQPRAAVSAQHLADRRRRIGDQACQPDRPKRRAPPSRQDHPLLLTRQPPPLPTRRRRPIPKTSPTSLPIPPPQPIPRRPTRTTPHRRHRRRHTSIDQRHNLAPRLPRQPLPSRTLRKLQTSGSPREQGVDTPSLTGDPERSPPSHTSVARTPSSP